MSDLSFASDFPVATEAGWRALVDKVLKGADFDRTLVGRTADGLTIRPLYPRAVEAPSLVSGRSGPWRIAQRMDAPDPAVANALALADLEGGADALTIVGPAAPGARGFGLPLSPDALERALAAVRLDLIQIRLEAGPDGADAARTLLALADRQGIPAGGLDLELGLDPIGHAAAFDTGTAADPDAAVAAAWREFGDRVSRLLLCDGRPYHEADAGEAQELAAVLATGVAYLRALERAGLGPEDGRGRLSALLVADADQFVTIAKFRAFRRLWAEVEGACGLRPVPIRLGAETAWRMTTARDPWVNLLRGTVAAAAAGLGGADGVCVLPFTAPLGLPDAFARRLARNTQLILLEEGNLWRVADPVAGSGAFESLTESLADEAWSLFGAIEREGGIARSLRDGALPGRIARVAAGRERAVATRRTPITGTSEFPDLGEAPVPVLAPRPTGGPRPAGLPSRRASEPFELLRDRADRAARQPAERRPAERRPGIFLANLGPLSAFSARATFAANAFAAGGIAAQPNDGFASLDAMVAAFRASGLAAACLCSSDAVYADEAAPAARALRAAGARTVVLAGRPGEAEGALREAGIDRFLFAGGDLASFLGAFLNEEAGATGPSAEDGP